MRSRTRRYDTRPMFDPWLVVLLIMAVTLLMAWCSEDTVRTRARADDGLSDSIERYDRRLATHRVERYRSALGFAAPISISVDREAEMPKQQDGRRVDAHTTRSWEGEGCVVHVTRISVQRASVLAHEVCHCKLDYLVLGAWGYVGIRAEERRARELAAIECEDGLMKRGSW